jgi:hypothetical protein
MNLSTRGKSGVALVSALLIPGVALAVTPITTYHVHQEIGEGSVIGVIATDGVIGLLDTGDFVSWSLRLNGVGASFRLTNLNSGVDVVGSDVSATKTRIRFNFSGSDDGFLLFQDGLGGGNTYWCNATSNGVCNQGKSVVPQSWTYPSAQFASETGTQVIARVRAATASSALSVPESSTSAMMALGFAGLGLLGYRQTVKTRLSWRPLLQP